MAVIGAVVQQQQQLQLKDGSREELRLNYYACQSRNAENMLLLSLHILVSIVLRLGPLILNRHVRSISPRFYASNPCFAYV